MEYLNKRSQKSLLAPYRRLGARFESSKCRGIPAVQNPHLSGSPIACRTQAEYDHPDSFRQNSQRLLKFLLN
jgi:hypothetical protein